MLQNLLLFLGPEVLQVITFYCFNITPSIKWSQLGTWTKVKLPPYLDARDSFFGDVGRRFLKCQWGPPPELKDLGKLELQPENQGEIIDNEIVYVDVYAVYPFASIYSIHILYIHKWEWYSIRPISPWKKKQKRNSEYTQDRHLGQVHPPKDHSSQKTPHTDGKSMVTPTSKMLKHRKRKLHQQLGWFRQNWNAWNSGKSSTSSTWQWRWELCNLHIYNYIYIYHL